jgi:hypothetical protein
MAARGLDSQQRMHVMHIVLERRPRDETHDGTRETLHWNGQVKCSIWLWRGIPMKTGWSNDQG